LYSRLYALREKELTEDLDKKEQEEVATSLMEERYVKNLQLENFLEGPHRWAIGQVKMLLVLYEKAFKAKEDLFSVFLKANHTWQPGAVAFLEGVAKPKTRPLEAPTLSTDRGASVRPSSVKEWTSDLLKQFLETLLIPNNRVSEIDIKLKDVNEKELKKILIEGKEALLARTTADAPGILFVRKINGKLVMLRLNIVCYKKKDNPDARRCALEIVSSHFSEDALRAPNVRSWKTMTAPIEKLAKQNKINPILSTLLVADFLNKDLDADTQLDCYAVTASTKYDYTHALCKLLKVLTLELGVPGDELSIIACQKRYQHMAEHPLIGDPSVGKAQQGFAYQEHLTMLLAYLANKSDDTNDFSLICEAMVPPAWNDIVFDWNGQLVFFQQKHRSEYASTVEESYSTTELLASDGDASILKYYRAYCEIVTAIKDPRHPLRHYKDQLDSKNIKFIFFTNRKLPLKPQSKGGFTLKKIDPIYEGIVFERVTSDEAPLMTLKGFKEVIGERPVHKIRSCTAAQLGLEPNDEKMLNDFLESFYFFSNQKNSRELFKHCKEIIKAKWEGFGQGYLAEDFRKYIHNGFISDKPKRYVYDRESINYFFEDHEIYHRNLVKYSCPHHQEKIFESNDYFKPLYDLPCIENIKKILNDPSNDPSHIIIFCHEPMVARSIIQELFPAGERQIFTPISPMLNRYELASSLGYAITVGEDDELLGVIGKIKSSSKHRHTKIIQIKVLSPKSNNITETNHFALTVKAEMLEFLKEKYPLLTLLDSKTEMCLIDLLLFATSELTPGLSLEEHSKYVPQELSKEEIILPYNKLEEGIRAWIEKYPDFVKTSWLEYTEHFLNVIQINLPRHLPKISTKEVPAGGAFFWNEEILTFVYLAITCDLKDNDARYKMMWPDTEEVNLKNLLEKVHNHIEAHHPDLYYKYQNQHLPLYKEITQLPRYISIKLCRPYTGIPLPKENWSMSRDNTTIFYHHDGKPKLLSLDWSNIHSTSTISVVEAEAACGKTWFLKSKINLEKTLKDNRIPVFISIKDFEKVKNIAELTSEIIDQSSLPSYLRRIAKQWPKYFHLLLDGFDELPQSLLGNFEIMLQKIVSKDYSVTITVRDYQTHTLQERVNHIILKNRLHKFDDKKIKECLEKALLRKIPIETFDVEINRLCHFVNQQTNLGEWLGIPLHIVLLSEWYLLNRRNLQEVSNPSIAEIYNFIIQHRIKRNSKMNPADFYKFSYVTAINQVSDKNKVPLILSLKRYNFKEEVRFDLGRSGLLKNPFSEKPEFFHRSFAEFFIAKKFLRKIIKNPENPEFNLKLIQFLYQTENRLICYFFIELLKIHHTDSDISYELTGSQENEFSNGWLLDLSGQKLSEHKKEGVIAFQVLECPKKSNDIEKFDYQLENKQIIKDAKELMDVLRKNRPISIDLSTSVSDWINNDDLSLDGLLKLLSRRFQENGNVGSCFNILGLYLRIKNNDTVRGKIFGTITAPACLENCLRQNYDVLLWWKIDDLLSLISANVRLTADSEIRVNIDLIRDVILGFSSKVLIKNKLLATSKKNICEMLSILDPGIMRRQSVGRRRRDEKHPNFREKRSQYPEYLELCCAIYQNTHNIEILNALHIFIRKLNIKAFLRCGYPRGGPSIFGQYETLCEFDIDSVKKAFIQLKEMCKKSGPLYGMPLPENYPFNIPVIKCIGPHLNIVHVFYLILGKPRQTHLSYDTLDDEYKLDLSELTCHIETINPDIDLKVIFCSALVFLSLVSRGKLTQEPSKLSTIVADNLVRIFERLLNSPEINPQANLFIRILFVNFMLYFDLRGYPTQPSKEEAELSILTLIASNGYSAKLNIRCSTNLLLEYRQIASCFSRIKCEEDRLQYFFNIWDECVKNKLQVPLQVLSSFVIDSHISMNPITNLSQLEKIVSLKQGTKRKVEGLINEALPISLTVTGNDALETEGDNGRKRAKLANNKDTLSCSSGHEAVERGLSEERAGSTSFTGASGAAKGKVLLLSSEARGLGYDPNNTVDVSGLGNNCGLFALALAIKLRLKQTPNVKISENLPKCFNEISEISLRNSTINTDRAGKVLRAELNQSLITNHDYKNKRYQSFLNHLKKILKNESPDIDMEAFIVPNRDYSKQLQKKWQLRIKELEEAYECSEKKYRDHLHVPINLDNVAQLTAELSRLALQSTDSKTIEELLNRYKDKRLNLTDQYVDLMRLFNTCWLSIDREKGSPEERGRLSEIIKMRFVKIASEALKSEASVNSFLMLSFASETQLGDDGSLKTIVEKREIYSRVITFFADINLQENWEMVYKNYCDYISSKDVMLTADELGCLASYWKVQLTIHFNSESPYRSYLKPDNRLIQVTLSNRSGNHWQVRTTEFIMGKKHDVPSKVAMSNSVSTRKIIAPGPSPSTEEVKLGREEERAYKLALAESANDEGSEHIVDQNSQIDREVIMNADEVQIREDSENDLDDEDGSTTGLGPRLKKLKGSL
jgi:hypothetical protein